MWTLLAQVDMPIEKVEKRDSRIITCFAYLVFSAAKKSKDNILQIPNSVLKCFYKELGVRTPAVLGNCNTTHSGYVFLEAKK